MGGFVVLLLLGFLLFGTVVADWFLGGHTTRGYGLRLMGGGLLVILLFGVGVLVARKHRNFLGFSLWQWVVLTLLSVVGGISVRIFMF